MGTDRGPTGVLITHDSCFADESEPPYYAWTPLKASGLNKPPYCDRPLSVTRLVELPMRFMEFTMTMSNEPCEEITLLSIDCDPESTNFGNAQEYCGMEALLARVGGEDLAGFHVKALVNFVKTVLADLVAFGDLDEDDNEAEKEAMRSKAEIAAAKATRADFETFYESSRAECVAKDEKFKVVESPYDAVPWRADTPSCACGSREGTDGAALLLCGRCKKARYCSQVCQKKAWKSHKKICRSQD